MNYLRSFLAPRPACAPAARLRVETLEERAMPSGTEWLLRLQGLTGTTIAEQMDEARALIEAAHIQDVEIDVVDHATLDGNIVIETPERTPLEVIRRRLSCHGPTPRPFFALNSSMVR